MIGGVNSWFLLEDEAPLVAAPTCPTPRSSGIHVSEIIYFLGAKLGYSPDDIDFASREIQIKSALGIAWEEYLAAHNPHIDFHFGEVERDGISGNPDGLSVETIEGIEVPVVEEFKVTWMSTRWGLEDPRGPWCRWIQQVMSYCAIMGVNHGRIWVVNTNGDYTTHRPVFYRRLFHFPQRDLDRWWATMLRIKGEMRLV